MDAGAGMDRNNCNGGHEGKDTCIVPALKQDVILAYELYTKKKKIKNANVMQGF